MICRICYVFGAFALLSAMLFAQTSTATLEGHVKDPSGGSISGARIQVVNAQTNTSKQVATNNEGYFVIPYLLPGEYSITAERTGFRRFTQSAIKLDVQQVLSFDIALTLGDVNATVEVTASTPPLATSSSVVSTTVDNKKVVDL